MSEFDKQHMWDATVTDADKQLERAIHMERVRLKEVLFCAHLFHCICPCICKYDPDDLKLASEEEMLEIAVYQEGDKLAQRYIPEEAPKMHRHHHHNVDDSMIVRDGRSGSSSSESSREDDIEVDDLADDDIFDWEKHIDPNSGVPYYYNPK